MSDTFRVSQARSRECPSSSRRRTESRPRCHCHLATAEGAEPGPNHISEQVQGSNPPLHWLPGWREGGLGANPVPRHRVSGAGTQPAPRDSRFLSVSCGPDCAGPVGA